MISNRLILRLILFPSVGLAGVCATVFHDGAMNPIEGVLSLYFLPFKNDQECIIRLKTSRQSREFFPPDNVQLQVF